MYEYGSDFDFDGSTSDYEEGYAPRRATRTALYESPSDVLPTVLEVRYGVVA